MGVSHQHHRLLVGQPEKDLEAGFVIEVMGAFALSGIAPGARDMAGGENILQEMQREASSNR